MTRQNTVTEEFRRGIILDVDGTLWDAVKEIAESWNLYGEDMPDVTGHFTCEQMKACLGKTMYEIADVLYGYLPEERRQEVLTGAMEFENGYLHEHPGKVYPDVYRTMECLKEAGWHLYIVSNCQKGYIEEFLHASGVGPLIEDYLCFGDTLHGKGYNIRLCREKNRLDYAVYVGDTAGDMEAALEAGTDFIFAQYGFGDVADTDKVKGRIGSFGDLFEAVSALRQGE